MKPEIKAQWVAALRSGEYTQGKGALHVRKQGQDTFCCLGVLCDLAVKAGVATPVPGNDGGRVVYKGNGSYNSNAYYVPALIAEWAGFVDADGVQHADPTVTVNGITAHLSSHNDGGIPFTAIAEAIEGQVP